MDTSRPKIILKLTGPKKGETMPVLPREIKVDPPTLSPSPEKPPEPTSSSATPKGFLQRGPPQYRHGKEVEPGEIIDLTQDSDDDDEASNAGQPKEDVPSITQIAQNFTTEKIVLSELALRKYLWWQKERYVCLLQYAHDRLFPTPDNWRVSLSRYWEFYNETYDDLKGEKCHPMFIEALKQQDSKLFSLVENPKNFIWNHRWEARVYADCPFLAFKPPPPPPYIRRLPNYDEECCWDYWTESLIEGFAHQNKEFEELIKTRNFNQRYKQLLIDHIKERFPRRTVNPLSFTMHGMTLNFVPAGTQQSMMNDEEAYYFAKWMTRFYDFSTYF